MYAPDDTMATPAEMQASWSPNYTQMPTPRSLAGARNHASSPVKKDPWDDDALPRTPRRDRDGNRINGIEHGGPGGMFTGDRKLSPAEDARRRQMEGETKEPYYSSSSPRSSSSRNRRSPRNNRRQQLNTYSDGHGSATLSMAAQEGMGLDSRAPNARER